MSIVIVLITLVLGIITFFAICLIKSMNKNEQGFQQALRQNPQQALDQLMMEYNLGSEIIAYKAGKPVKARRINGKVVIVDEVPKRGRNKPSI